MLAVVYAFLSALGALFRSRLSLRVENVALRHQLAIYQRTVKRPMDVVRQVSRQRRALIIA